MPCLAGDIAEHQSLRQWWGEAAIIADPDSPLRPGFAWPDTPIIDWTATTAATPSAVAIFLSGGQAGGSADGGEPGRMALRLAGAWNRRQFARQARSRVQGLMALRVGGVPGNLTVMMVSCQRTAAAAGRASRSLVAGSRCLT